jgi:hypothetical protein
VLGFGFILFLVRYLLCRSNGNGIHVALSAPLCMCIFDVSWSVHFADDEALGGAGTELQMMDDAEAALAAADDHHLSTNDSSYAPPTLPSSSLSSSNNNHANNHTYDIGNGHNDADLASPPSSLPAHHAHFDVYAVA